MNAKILQPGESTEIDDIKIEGIKSVHGDLPNGKPKPDVIGFLIDDKFYHRRHYLSARKALCRHCFCADLWRCGHECGRGSPIHRRN